MRDFWSYEPGRYYWCFAWSLLFGRGLLGIRHAGAVFQVLGLWAGLLAAGRAVAGLPALVLVGVLLVWWMQPRHKLFEHGISLIAVYVAVRLVETPTLPCFFWAGLVVGLAAFFGRNHGAYTFSAFAVLLLVLRLEGNPATTLPSLFAWLGGIASGCSPIFTMLVFVPGMAGAWRASLAYLGKRGQTNIALPIPWPWKTGASPPDWTGHLSRRLLGVHFLLLPVFYSGAAVWLVIAPSIDDLPLLAASASVGSFYLHQAFSRADLAHLCQASQPFLLGVLALVSSFQGQNLVPALLAVLLVVAFFTVRPLVPLMVMLDHRKSFVEYDLREEKLWLFDRQATMLDALLGFVDRNLEPDEPLLIAPHMPGLYPALRRRTPVQMDYLLVPDTVDVQERMIADLEREGVNWALVRDHPLDGRDDLRLRNTFPLLWSYLRENFTPVPLQGIAAAGEMLRRRSPSEDRSAASEP